MQDRRSEVNNIFSMKEIFEDGIGILTLNVFRSL